MEAVDTVSGSDISRHQIQKAPPHRLDGVHLGVPTERVSYRGGVDPLGGVIIVCPDPTTGKPKTDADAPDCRGKQGTRGPTPVTCFLRLLSFGLEVRPDD